VKKSSVMLSEAKHLHFISLKTNKCRFLASLGMTGPGDFFTASYALGHSMPPLTGLRKTGAHARDLLDELLTQGTRTRIE